MAVKNGICGSCGCSSASLKQIRRWGAIELCNCCNSWVKMSLRRTKRVPTWIRPDPNMTQDEIAEMREAFLQLRDRHGRGRWAERRMIFEMGFSYLGPLNDSAWGLALSTLGLQQGTNSGDVLLDIPDAMIEEELTKLEKVGIIHLPSNPLMRAQIAHLLRGDLGLANKRRFITGLFLWLIDDDEFRGRDKEAWAKSFQFLQEVVNDLGDRADFVDNCIRVIGSSGNTYRIRPRPHPPHYIVSREVEDGQNQTICIDPVNAHTVVFGDILVNLVLALYDDQISARHIDTLARHVFGDPRTGHLGRQRRNVNIEHLWRRALGTMPGDQPEPQQAFQRWRRVVDRFQTNLADWAEEEEEEE